MPSPSGGRVQLGGRKRTLRLTAWALYSIELETPEQTALIHTVRAARGSVRSLALLTWACLLHDDETLQVEDVVRMDGFALTNEDLLTAITDQVNEAYPEQGKAEAATDVA